MFFFSCTFHPCFLFRELYFCSHFLAGGRRWGAGKVLGIRRGRERWQLSGALTLGTVLSSLPDARCRPRDPGQGLHTPHSFGFSEGMSFLSPGAEPEVAAGTLCISSLLPLSEDEGFLALRVALGECFVPRWRPHLFSRGDHCRPFPSEVTGASKELVRIRALTEY